MAEHALNADTWRTLTQDYSQYQELLEWANDRLDIHQRAGLCRRFLTDNGGPHTPPFLGLLSCNDCPEDIGRLLQILRTVSDGGHPQASHNLLCVAIKARRMDCHQHVKALQFALNSTGARLAQLDYLVWQALDRAANFDLRCGVHVIDAQAAKSVEVRRQVLALDKCVVAPLQDKSALSLPLQSDAAAHVEAAMLIDVHVAVTRELWTQQLAWLRAALKIDGDPKQQPALPGFNLEQTP